MKTIVYILYFVLFIFLSSCNDRKIDHNDEMILISERVHKIELALNRMDSILAKKADVYGYQTNNSNISSGQIATEYVINMFLDSIPIIDSTDTLNINLTSEGLSDTNIVKQPDLHICEYLDIEIDSITPRRKAWVRINGAINTEFRKKGDIILDKNEEEFEITEISIVNKNITLRHIQSDSTCIVN